MPPEPGGTTGLKASPSPLRGRDFARLERRLIRKLRAVLGPVNAEAVAAVEATLNAVDWTDPAGWRSVVASVHRQLRVLRDVVPGEVEPVLAKAVTDMVRATRIACIADLTNKHRVRSRGAKAVFGTPNPQTLARLQRVRRIVVKQGWAEHIIAFSDSAREMLLTAAEQGLSRHAVGERLFELFGTLNPASKRPLGEDYWSLVGSAWLNTARNRVNLDTYHDAGITRYRILAVMDERTSPVCAALNGTVFSVADQLEREERACRAETLDELRAVSPWLHARDGKDGKPETVGFRGPGHKFVAVARREGKTFSRLDSPDKLQRLGVGMPPYHARCRTTVVPV
ncbi:MAG: minor capsid protein [Myxococcota bacterium]